jgi:integrase
MLAKRPLTDRGISALKAAEPGKRTLVWDAMVPGLAIRVTDKGTKAFVLVARFPGSPNPTARAIGRVGAVSLEDARTKAREWQRLIAAGNDPAEEPRREAGTLQAVCLDWLARDGAQLRSVKQLRSALERNVFPVLGAKPIGEIKRSEIVRLLDQVEDERGRVAANRALALIRRVCNWHAARSDDFRSPIVRGMARAETARDRILTDDELRRIWAATYSGSYSDVFGAFIRFLLLTAARRTEVVKMTWSELSEGVWTLPARRNKTGVELVRPLSKAALDAIAVVPRLSDEFVFSRNGVGAIGGLGELKTKLDHASGAGGWVLHDLRRTARSLMSRAGVPSDHAERCLGHIIPGIRGIYDRHLYRDEMLVAYEKLAALIAEITRS